MSAASATPSAVGYVALVRQNKKFRLLWMGQIVSLLGDWFDLIASASLIAILTQSGAAVGGSVRRADAGAVPDQPDSPGWLPTATIASGC